MPPRKRRQSAQGDDVLKENCEKALSPPPAGTESGKQVKAISKTPEPSTSQPERRLTARQQSKQDALQETLQAGKAKELAVPAAAGPELSGKQPTRFSTRIVKRPRRDLSPPDQSPAKKGKKTATTPSVSNTPETKGKRQWELWSVEDKDSFFEGLCEFGKDFESIHNLIVNKCKKKGAVMPVTVKNKEQVRHFYYRTWHKISKLIQPVEDLKKDIQELYGLISYSVLRKKLRGGVNPNDKNWQKLNDLVHQGVATIKVKGKRIRVKTPICNALKKLNCYEEPKRDSGPKVPDKIRVEFRPKTNIAWQHVQDLSHNPRVRVTVQPDRHLQSLVKHLEQKWKGHRLKLWEHFSDTEIASLEFRVYPHRDSTLRNINMEPVDEPVLQFSLNKHCKENTFSPTTSKRKKDNKELNVPAKPVTSVSVGVETGVDLSKSVINDDSCACTDACSVCAVKEGKGCGSQNDLVKSGAQKDFVNCSCLCNREQVAGSENKATSSDKFDGEGLAPRSLFGPECDLSKSMKFPGDSSDTKCVMMQSESPKYRSDELASCLQSSRSNTTSEISAIVDGEDAMFPDSIGQNTETEYKITITETESNLKPDLEAVRSKLDSISKVGEKNTQNSNSSQKDFKKAFEHMLEHGFNFKDGDNLTLAELYLMFGEDGELKFEYEWVSKRREADIIQEKLLNNLNNMLRRLSHIAMVEFTDFTKTPGANSACQLCGQTPNARKSQGRGKDKSPVGVAKLCKGKDASTQTQALRFNPVPVSTGVPTSNQNGVFRIPVLPALSAPKPVPIQPSKEILARYNPANNTHQKQLMRPRKVRQQMSRGRAGMTGTLVQRTILPKNSEYITIIPMAPGTQFPNIPSDKTEVTETIVGHPINGIQKQPISVITTSPCSTVTMVNHVIFGSPSVTTSSSCNSSELMEMSLSPDGDQTLLRIPASHLGSMSQEALKAAGLSAMPSTPVSTPVTIVTTPLTTCTFETLSTSTPIPSTAGSLSPPNLSALLDISLPTGEIETDTSFSNLLEDSNKTLDPILVTPPIRTTSEQRKSLHSPPVRSLFQPSPNPDQQWLGGDVPDLSLTSFLESPSKPSASSSSSMFNPNMPLSLFNENSRDFHAHRNDVESTFQSMMNESSIDYMNNFADLAVFVGKETAGNDPTRKLD